MLKKLETPPVAAVRWQGEIVAEVRGLTPADVTAVLISAGEDLAGLFSVVDDVSRMKLDPSDAPALADQLMKQWPGIVESVGVHMPNIFSQLIARAADAPDEWEMVRDNYSFVLQFEILAEIARLTFNGPEAFGRFVGNVLLLVDLGGALTSNGTKRSKIKLDPANSVAG